MKQGRIKNIENILKNKKIKTHGVEIDLTEEQLQKLEKLVEPKHPFKRVDKGENYYFVEPYVDGVFSSLKLTENYNELGDMKFNNGNYYNNKEFAEQVAMDLNLQQKLRKFTYENGWSDELWEDTNTIKYSVFFDWLFKNWCFGTTLVNRNLFDVYFKDAEVARRAIEEVVKPFCQENPNYRFQEE